MPLRTDNIPLPLKPIFMIYGYGLGILLFLFVRILSTGIRVSIEGSERLSREANYIFAMWHTENGPAFVSSFFRRAEKRFALLNHPLWYMKPSHVMLHLLGVEKLVLGSSGHGGREAADAMVQLLRQGYSTHINPDGPAGPASVLKKGVLHLAAQSGAAVVPVQFICSRQWIFRKSWDSKRLPLPFSRIIIRYGQPVVITADTIDRSAAILQSAL